MSMQSLSWLVVVFFGCLIPSFASEAYSWKDKESYYFTDLRLKVHHMTDGMGRCEERVHLREEGSIDVPPSANIFFIRSIPYDLQLFQWWKMIAPPRQHRVDSLLCDAPQSKKRPIFDQDGCLIENYMMRSAPRCQNSYLKYLCYSTRKNVTDASPTSTFIPEADHRSSFVPPMPWLLTTVNTTVSHCGHITSPCGNLRTTANCMASNFDHFLEYFRSACLRSSESFHHLKTGESLPCSNSIGASDRVHYYSRVFVIAEVDDTYVYHIHLEIIPRVLYHLEFLQQNPDIKILYGCDSKKTKRLTQKGLELGVAAMKLFFELLDLDPNRLIVHQHVYANEVYLPMEGGCQDPVYNTWQILTMRQFFLKKIGIGANYFSLASKPIMLVVKRSSSSKSTRNSGDLVRQWSEKFTKRLQDSLVAKFPGYDVKLFDDKDPLLMGCIACQIKKFAEASVVVGMHGAGLANIIYMRPNSAVIEFCPYGNDGRCIIGGGPFNRAAVLLSHDYLVHYALKSEYVFDVKTASAEFDVARFVNHIHSFLLSSNRLPHKTLAE